MQNVSAINPPGVIDTRNFTGELANHITRINQYIDFRNILDYGCGNGEFVKYLKHRGYNAYGYDPYVPGYQEKPSQSFDVISSIESMEHFGCHIKEEFDYIASHCKLLYMVTGIYRGERRWHYALPQFGHCSIISEDTIRYLKTLYKDITIIVRSG